MQKASFARKFLVYILPLIVWMAIIFGMSTPTMSAETTRKAVSSILRRYLPAVAARMTPEQIDEADYMIRKAAHITEYTILGLLAFRAFRYGRRDFRSRYPAFTLLFGLLYAASDEFHQSFHPERGATVVDVLIDMVGIVIAVMLHLWWHCLLLRRQAASPLPPSPLAESD